MVLNGYTILSVFFCLLRLLLSLVVVGVGLSSWRLSRRPLPPDQTETVENRSYLLFLSATVLIGINVASWPILYSLLQSYVQEWPSVMCIYGVTKIGAGTLGASRFLPALLNGLQWTKPLLVFVSGAGYVLYLINRRTRTAPLQNRVLMVLLLIGASTLVDSVVEAAYLVIPKKEIRLEGGCCTNSLEIVEQAAKFTPRIRLNEKQRPYLIAAYYSLNMAMIVGLFAHAVFTPRQAVRRWRWPLLLGALLSIPVSLLYLIEVAAPTILGLPFHHCPYDLIPAAPESVVAVPLFLLGCFSVGWAFIAGQFGSCAETGAFLPTYISRLLFIGLFGYAGSILLMSIELLLA
jgi:hypothetical protein